jgi:hypothetical protein
LLIQIHKKIIFLFPLYSSDEPCILHVTTEAQVQCTTGDMPNITFYNLNNLQVYHSKALMNSTYLSTKTFLAIKYALAQSLQQQKNQYQFPFRELSEIRFFPK